MDRAAAHVQYVMPHWKAFFLRKEMGGGGGKYQQQQQFSGPLGEL